MRLSLLKEGLSENSWLFLKTTAVAHEESHCTEGRMVEPVSIIHLFIQQMFTQGLQVFGPVHCAGNLERNMIELWLSGSSEQTQRNKQVAGNPSNVCQVLMVGSQSAQEGHGQGAESEPHLERPSQTSVNFSTAR